MIPSSAASQVAQVDRNDGRIGSESLAEENRSLNRIHIEWCLHFAALDEVHLGAGEHLVRIILVIDD